MTQFTRKANMSPGILDTGDIVDANDINELQEAIEQQSFNVMRYGAIGDGVTDDTAAFLAAIDAAEQSEIGGGGSVYVPPGLYLISETLILPSRVRLLGASAATQGIYGGSVLIAADGMDADVLGTDDVWHWGEIAYIGIEGNKANNTSGSGINIGLMGETSTIHNVQVARCAEHGFVVSGESTPSYFADCSAMNNSKSGFYLDEVTRHVSLINPSGDGNGDSLISIIGTGAGPISFVNIIGIKSETGTDNTAHEPAVLIDNYGGNVNFLGGTIEGHADNTQLVAVQRSGANGGQVWFQGTIVARYAAQFDDAIASTNDIALGTGTHTLTGLVGKTSFDVSTGRHFSGRDAATASVSALSAAGSGASASVSGTDVRGTITLTTGSGAGVGSVVRLTFAQAYASAPRIILTPGNANAAGVIDTVYVSLTGGASVDTSVSSALADATEYQWHYVVIG